MTIADTPLIRPPSQRWEFHTSREEPFLHNPQNTHLITPILFAKMLRFWKNWIGGRGSSDSTSEESSGVETKDIGRVCRNVWTYYFICFYCHTTEQCATMSGPLM